MDIQSTDIKKPCKITEKKQKNDSFRVKNTILFKIVDVVWILDPKFVKKNDSEIFTKIFREIEAEREVFVACRSSEGHEGGSKIAHFHYFVQLFSL